MAKSKLINFITIAGDFILTWILAILSLILLIAAVMHSMGIGTPSYDYSPLIYIEVALVFTLIFLIPAYAISALIVLFKRNWKSLRVILVNLSLGMIFAYGALISDAPTLIHMT